MQVYIAGSIKLDGSFNAICRVPGLAILMKKEAEAIAGHDGIPSLPDYLFLNGDAYAPGKH